jgi:glycine/D-amino acid oxidase-like deaminating enzyme
MMAETTDVIIVGGGVLGASLAYYLTEKGVTDVVLFERGRMAEGSTGKSAAVVRMHYTNPSTVRLALRSRDLFLNWRDRVDDREVYYQTGWFFLTPPGQEATVENNMAMNRVEGVDVEVADTVFLQERAPGISLDDLGTVLYEAKSGYADPVGVCEGLAAAASRNGGRIVSGVGDVELIADGAKVIGVRAGTDTYEAPITVLAAGPWSGRMANAIGLNLPMEYTREQEIFIEPTDSGIGPTCSISNMCETAYIRPRQEGGFLLGRGYPKDYEAVDPDNFDEQLDDSFIADITTRIQKRFPGLTDFKMVGGVVGLYAVTPDWHPILGPVDAHPGLWLATGGSGHAFKIGPAIGEMLADMIVNKQCAWVDPGLFRLERFDAGETFLSSYGGNRA